MHSVWNLFKAEFAAEILSKILFSGKFPRFVGLFLFLIAIGWFIFWGIVRIIYRIFRWILITESMTVRKKLRAVTKAGKIFGDISDPILTTQENWKLKLTNPNYRMGISHVEFLVEKKTGRLRIFLYQQQESIEISYASLRQIAPIETHVNLHVDFAAYIYYQLRIGYL